MISDNVAEKERQKRYNDLINGPLSNKNRGTYSSWITFGAVATREAILSLLQLYPFGLISPSKEQKAKDGSVVFAQKETRPRKFFTGLINVAANIVAIPASIVAAVAFSALGLVLAPVFGHASKYADKISYIPNYLREVRDSVVRWTFGGAIVAGLALTGYVALTFGTAVIGIALPILIPPAIGLGLLVGLGKLIFGYRDYAERTEKIQKTEKVLGDLKKMPYLYVGKVTHGDHEFKAYLRSGESMGNVLQLIVPAAPAYTEGNEQAYNKAWNLRRATIQENTRRDKEQSTRRQAIQAHGAILHDVAVELSTFEQKVSEDDKERQFSAARDDAVKSVEGKILILEQAIDQRKGNYSALIETLPVSFPSEVEKVRLYMRFLSMEARQRVAEFSSKNAIAELTQKLNRSLLTFTGGARSSGTGLDTDLEIAMRQSLLDQDRVGLTFSGIDSGIRRSSPVLLSSEARSFDLSPALMSDPAAPAPAPAPAAAPAATATVSAGASDAEGARVRSASR